jgi:hypothetical protein
VSGARLALRSLGGFVRLVLAGALTQRRDRVGLGVLVGGRRYVVFRETVSRDAPEAEPVVLVIGFRLRFVGASPLAHRCFQRVCILTTPFWSGLPGFRVKLWLVDPQTQAYLGVYDWRGEQDARRYVAALLPVLRAVSERGSVWERPHAGELEAFLAAASG